MPNVSKLLSMFSAHPILLIAFIYFAFPIIVLAATYDISVKYLFPFLKYLYIKLKKFIYFTKSKINNRGIK